MTRLLALILVFLRRSLWLGAIVLMLMALYVSLGRQLVPLVAEYRLEAQDKASELLQMPVSIGRLEGRWDGFSPQLLAFDVQLGEGDAAMRLDRLSVVPDITASLWYRTTQIKTLEFAGAHLGVVQGVEGDWRVEGLPQREEQPPPDLQNILSELQRIASIRVVDSQVTVEAFGEGPQTLSYANLELRTKGEHLRLDGRLLLPDGQPLSLSGQANVQASDWNASEAQLYLSLPYSDWSAWIPASLTGDWSIGALRVGGELWLDWHDRGLARAVARLNGPELQVGHGQRDPVEINDLSLNAYIDRDAAGYRVQVEGLSFNFSDHRWQDSTFIARQQADVDGWQFQADRIALTPLAALVEALAPLPEVATEYLTGLAPSGTLRNVEAYYQPTADLPERLAFSANLDSVSIAAYHWIPAAQNVSGEVKGNLGGGELRFDSQDFSLHLAELFPAPWDYRRSRGRLNWTLNDEAFTLAAPYLRVEGEEGLIAGGFLIRLMRDPAAEDYMDLRVGISDADARFTGKYLPTRSPALSPALSEWLTSAIQGGTVEQGYFQYQGSLSKSAADTARSISLYFKVKDAELAFQPGWPLLRDGRGEVLIENSGVRVRVAEARMLDSRVHDVTADIPRSHAGQSPRLSIKGKVDGSVSDALTLVQTAPIGTEELFSGWRGQGPLSGQLHLDIPLDRGERPKATVDFVSSDASLYIAQVDLGFQGVEGAFRYDTESGLSAETISAQVLGTSIHGRASATGSPGKPVTRIEANGTVDVEQLKQWQKIERALPVSGQIPAQLSLTLGTDDTRLQVDSSLQGVAIDMPAPYGKPATERRDTTFRMTLNDDQQRYEVRHAGLAALTFAGPTADLATAGGELVLGGAAANLRDVPGLEVRGSVPRVDISEWQAWLEKYQQPSEDKATASLLRRVRLDVGTLEAFNTSVERLAIDLQRLPAAWQLGLDSQTVAGTVRVPDVQGQPVDVDLALLRLPAANPEVTEGALIEEERRDPLANVDPGQLPAVDIRVAQLMRGEELLGAGTLKMRPFPGGVDFSDLNVDLKGLKIGGAGGWSGSQSWFKGRLEGGNIEEVLLAWGLAPSTTSEDFRLDADARWPGSPAFFGLGRLSGQLDARMRKGQLREIDGGAQALRVFGLLNLESIGRRLRLDFSDLFSKGLSYDRIEGQLTASDGVYLTSKPLTVTGPSSNLELDGRLDMVADQIDAKVLVTLPVSNNLPLAALIVGAPAIGGALFVADKLLGDRVARFATVQYKVEGPWQAPKITFDKPFERPN